MTGWTTGLFLVVNAALTSWLVDIRLRNIVFLYFCLPYHTVCLNCHYFWKLACREVIVLYWVFFLKWAVHFSFLGLQSYSGGISCHPCKVSITRVMTLERGCYSLVFQYVCIYTGYTQKNCAVSKINKKFISHLTRTQCTLSAAATVQVSPALITILQCVHPGSHDTHPHGNQIHPRLGVACPL